MGYSATEARTLSAQDLLAGGSLVHNVAIPSEILRPGETSADGRTADGDESGRSPGKVRLRPLNVATLALISRAAREDPGLVPLLMVKEALVEPALSFEQVRQMHVGLVHFLVGQINRISGLAEDGSALTDAAGSPLGQAHILLARHFGWTPEQVSQLTPGQVAVYLAGIEQLLKLPRDAAS